MRKIITTMTGIGILLSSVGSFAELRVEEGEVSQIWVNNYVSQGRENLESGGISYFGTAATVDKVTASVLYGSATEGTYSEINMAFEYGFEVKDREAYASYTRLVFPEDESSDNEMGFGITLGQVGPFSQAIDYYYSTEAGGGFLELSLSSEHKVFDGHISVEPFLIEGLDFGYASPEHDGLNNLQIGFNLSTKLGKSFHLFATAAHDFAQEDVRRDGGDNVAWASAGINGSF